MCGLFELRNNFETFVFDCRFNNLGAGDIVILSC